MARTKRAQVLMEPDEYERLEAIATEQGIAVAELIRIAVRERYLLTPEDRRRLVEEILGLDLPAIDWDEAEDEVIEARGDGLS
ncbi:MAG TPA: hypothetical protein VEY33_15180 [Gemmatimonadota bacterium]|nr:hypothetical protein [Gemmatimonadota bacterium]